MTSIDDLLVVKFGGTSVGSLDRIKNVAKKVADIVNFEKKKVIVVVSAMSGETNRLVKLANDIGCHDRNSKEYQQIITSGEQVSSAMTALAIQNLGLKSNSFLAHQIGIKTENFYGQNLISNIDSEKLMDLVNDGCIPVVAGFQGVGASGDITALGRGGSDTSAVALAAAIGGARCIIFTDIDGVYSALPSICPGAKKLKMLSYEEMLELASGGAKVLHTRCVGLAKRYGVPLEVRSSFEDIPGTEITNKEKLMEKLLVSGITSKTDETKVTLRNLPDRPGIAAGVFALIASNSINVDMIVQSEGNNGIAQISFTIPSSESEKAKELIEQYTKQHIPEVTADYDHKIVKVSVIGEGMKNHSGVASKMFEALSKESINIQLITTSEIKISVVVDQKYHELALRSLHEALVENISI